MYKGKHILDNIKDEKKALDEKKRKPTQTQTFRKTPLKSLTNNSFPTPPATKKSASLRLITPHRDNNENIDKNLYKLSK